MAKTATPVAGMYRSGTSAVTRVSGLMGCSLSGTLMQSSGDDEMCSWESPSVVQLNDDVLASAGLNRTGKHGTVRLGSVHESAGGGFGRIQAERKPVTT